MSPRPNRRFEDQYLLRYHPDRRAAWETAASREGLSLAQWIRRTLDEKAGGITYSAAVDISTAV